MNDEFENQLRRAMRPMEAPEGFTERLMRRLPESRVAKPAVVVPLPVKPRRTRNFTLPAALAASLVAAVLLGQHLSQRAELQMQARELAEGEAASRELMEALRVTSQKLDLAYQAVNNPPRTSMQGEENPS